MRVQRVWMPGIPAATQCAHVGMQVLAFLPHEFNGFHTHVQATANNMFVMKV